MRNAFLIICALFLCSCTCKIVYVNIEGQNTIDAQDVQMKTETDQGADGQVDASLTGF